MSMEPNGTFCMRNWIAFSALVWLSVCGWISFASSFLAARRYGSIQYSQIWPFSWRGEREQWKPQRVSFLAACL